MPLRSSKNSFLRQSLQQAKDKTKGESIDLNKKSEIRGA